VSNFPWTYDSNESCYLLKGRVTVTPSDGREPVSFGAGDFVTFPAGMSCRWDVTEAVHKHFHVLLKLKRPGNSETEVQRYNRLDY
jgi:uncharacterized cupin superfamily protein